MRRVVWTSAFAVAMAYLESAVVVYLRKIYYPNGFRFPLVALDVSIAVTEIFREAATVVMLIAIGALVGRSRYEKFAFFLLSFAVWDIFYYVFLWLLLAWPESLMTWDILFLIPVMWVGPVVTPIILSLTMIVLAGGILKIEAAGTFRGIRPVEWALLIAGSVVVIVSFTVDYTTFVVQEGGWQSLFSMEAAARSIREQYIPIEFPWWIFVVGEGIIVAGIVKILKRGL
jgi:hypothetical protein